MTTERLNPPGIVPLDHILPDEPLLMMGAGPVPIPHRVAQANSIVINHLGETMARVVEQVKSMARYVFQTTSGHVMGVAGPGSAAMEMAVCNLVAPGTPVLAVVNGYFSQRLAEMATRVGGEVTTVHVDGNRCASPEDIATLLARLDEHALVVPRHAGQWGHPVGFGRQYFAPLRQLTGDRGARQTVGHEKGDADNDEAHGVHSLGPRGGCRVQCIALASSAR